MVVAVETARREGVDASKKVLSAAVHVPVKETALQTPKMLNKEVSV